MKKKLLKSAVMLIAIVLSATTVALGQAKKAKAASAKTTTSVKAAVKNDWTQPLVKEKGQKVGVRKAPKRVKGQSPLLKAPAAGSSDLFGLVIYSDDYNAPLGVYELPTSGTPTALNLMAEVDASKSYGAGSTYVILDDKNQAHVYDIDTWAEVSTMQVPDEMYFRVATYVAADNALYGIFPNYDLMAYVYGKISLDTFELTTLNEKLNNDEVWDGLTIADNGNLYAISRAGKLLQVDKATGETTAIGETGLTASFPGGIVFDPASGTILWSVNPSDYNAYLYSVDISTAAATLIYQMPNNEEVINLYIAPKAEVADDTPLAPQLAVGADPNGALNAAVSVVAPSQDAGGTALTAIDALIVERNGEEIHTFDAPKPGALLSFYDVVPSSGSYMYTAYAVVDGIKGLVAKTSVYMGVSLPVIPENVAVVETSTPGEVTITWDPVTEDIRGLALSDVTYMIIDYNGIVVEDLKECSYTYQAVPEGEQDFVMCGVYAVDEVGMSEDYGLSNILAVGTPYALPFRESAIDGAPNYAWAEDYPDDSSAAWSFRDLTASGLAPQDEDGGSVSMRGYYVGDESTLISGKISLDGAKDAVLAFYYFCMADDDENTLTVSINDGTESKVVKEIVLGEGDVDDWNRVAIPMADYAGKTIQLEFTGVINTYSYIVLDNLCLEVFREKDLTAESINAPVGVAPDTDFEISVNVINNGTQAATGWSVSLYRDGELAETINCEELASFGRTTVSFTQSLPINAPESTTYNAVVNYEGDENIEDNTTENVVVALLLPDYPVAENLEAAAGDDGVALTWTAPTDPTAKVPETESFESFDNLATSGLDPWTLVDNDGLTAGGIQGVSTVEGQKLAYFVVDVEADGMSQVFKGGAHSGTHFISTMFPDPDDGSAPILDDWIISPELTGAAQTVSFFATSYTASYPETFQVLYSTTDKELDSFTMLNEYANVPAAWTEYTVPLPKGAKYFAIRCISTDKFMLLVDDITYIGVNSPEETLEILGYNIYRDNEKINDALVAATSYTDTTWDGQEATYQVTVVYANGESALSAGATVEASGIADITAAGIAVSGANRAIMVKGANGKAISVVSPDGKLIARTAGAAVNTIPVERGIYIVKIGKAVTKVIVK